MLMLPFVAGDLVVQFVQFTEGKRENEELLVIGQTYRVTDLVRTRVERDITVLVPLRVLTA